MTAAKIHQFISQRKQKRKGQVLCGLYPLLKVQGCGWMKIESTKIDADVTCESCLKKKEK